MNGPLSAARLAGERPELVSVGREGVIAPAGKVALEIIHPDGSRTYPGGEPVAPADTIMREPVSMVPPGELSLREILHYGTPQRGLPDFVNAWRKDNAPHLWRGLKRLLAARTIGRLAGGLTYMTGALSLVVIRASGEVEDYGLASMRVVTNNGVGFIVDAFQNLVELENMKYHGIGTGATAEAAADAALVTESTTALNPDNTRATGSTTETSSNIYRTVGTNTVDASVACTEHGIFSQAATGGGVLLDRSVFSVLNLASGDSLQTTYDLTLTAGG